MELELQKGSRSRWLAGGLLLVVAIIIARLFYLQVVRHDYYVALADQEQLKSRVITAERGEIYALNGDEPVPLVMNETVYTVFADPPTVKDKDAVIDALTEIAGGNTRDNFGGLLDKKDTRYQILATKLTRTQADKLKEKDLAGIGFQSASQRVYPEGSLAAQTLGFVNAEGVGNYGIEGGLDERLKGENGLLKTVTDVRYVPLTIGDQNVNIPAKDGEDVVLTIDSNIQAYTEKALQEGLKKAGASEGSVVVMDPNNGQVLAIANSPSYDPAKYNEVTDGARFNNAVISLPYEPASVMKTFIMATGVEEGVMSPKTTYYNNDFIKVYDRTIWNSYRGLTGTQTMQFVLNNSLNTGTVTVAQLLGDGTSITKKARDTMYEYYHDKFGLGEPTGIELANELMGTVVSPDEVEGNAVRYANMTFGQGLNVTMMQVSAGFCSIVNGGTYYKPTIVAGTLDEEGDMSPKEPVIERQTVSSGTSSTMRGMLHTARQSVAYMREADKPGYTIGGKTGTAETIQDGVYIKSQTVGTYLGYGGGKDGPEYVIMVRVAEPGASMEGGIHASPIFTDISNWMIDYLGVQPN